jgi:hypothetical protein
VFDGADLATGERALKFFWRCRRKFGSPESGDAIKGSMLIRKAAIAATLVVTSCMPAVAGGDDYDAMNDTEGEGPAYFGFVRDQRGLPVSDAQVLLQPKSGNPVTIKTDILGFFRSHIRKDVVPDDVQITCEKSGYKQSKVYRRTPPGGKDMFIETECTLQRL